MGYYNYHATAKLLIREGHLVDVEIKERHNAIAPAMILYFDNHAPMPVRREKWEEYLRYIADNIDLRF